MPVYYESVSSNFVNLKICSLRVVHVCIHLGDYACVNMSVCRYFFFKEEIIGRSEVDIRTSLWTMDPRLLYDDPFLF